MADKARSCVAGRHVRSAIEASTGRSRCTAGLGDEQKTAIRHVTGSGCMACIDRYGGSREGTARSRPQAWEEKDRRVFRGRLPEAAEEPGRIVGIQEPNARLLGYSVEERPPAGGW